MSKQSQAPRGIRNNNPGNLEWGQPWQGLVDKDARTDERFCQFKAPVDGIRAIARTLITYQDKRKAADGSRIDTVEEIISRWAPSVENNTDAYAAGVAKFLHVGPTDEGIDVHNYDHLFHIVSGIIRHECGGGPLKTLNSWYGNDVIEEGLRRAGVVRQVKPVVTTETAGAIGAGGLGVAQLTEVLPTFFAHWQNAKSSFDSGDVVQVVFGVGTVLLAGWIAYAQYRKRMIGAA